MKGRNKPLFFAHARCHVKKCKTIHLCLGKPGTWRDVIVRSVARYITLRFVRHASPVGRVAVPGLHEFDMNKKSFSPLSQTTGELGPEFRGGKHVLEMDD